MGTGRSTNLALLLLVALSLATGTASYAVGTAPATALVTTAHGGPRRLVAPGRRGFWWVKWVEVVEVVDEPPWLQLPFPLR